MPDILDAAQKQINDAANKLNPPAAAGSAPPPADPAPSTPTPPPDPAPAPPPAAPPMPAPEQAKPPEPVASEPTPEESAFVDKLIHQTSQAPASTTPEPLAQGATPSTSTPLSVNSVEGPPPPPPEPVAPPAEEKPTPPPAPPKKKGSGRAAMIAAILLLLVTLPLGVFFVSQQQKLTGTRSRAAVAEPCKTCEGSKCVQPPGLKPPNCSHTLDECTGDANCKKPTSAATATPRPAATSTPRPAATATPRPAGGTGPTSTPAPPATGGPTGDVSGANCSGYNINIATGKCESPRACRTYGECCGPGKVRTVKATCLSDGREQFAVGSCVVDNSGTCGTSGTGKDCTAGWFFWPKKDGGDDACHDISAPRQPGGGTSNCSLTGGCSLPSGGGCAKRYICSAAELTPQGFCLQNFADAQPNTSYQEEANRTCKYIQLDVFNQDKCTAGITTTTAHDGTIMYRPDLSGPGCTGGGGGGGGKTTTMTTTTNPPQCTRIRVYKGGTQLDSAGLAGLKQGDVVTLAVAGANASQGRIRVNGGDWNTTTNKNTNDEFTVDFTIPANMYNFTIEAEVFGDGVWK